MKFGKTTKAVDAPSVTSKESKSKRKKFGLFKSKKNKNGTPETVSEEQERELFARSLLAELDMAAADAGADGEVEGTELILPSPEYVEPLPEQDEKPVEKTAVVEEEKKEDDIDTSGETDNINTSADTAETDDSNVNTSGETDGSNVNTSGETEDSPVDASAETEESKVDESAIVEEAKVDESAKVEEAKVDESARVEEAKDDEKTIKSVANNAANKAVQLLATALSCAVPMPEKLGETFLSPNTVDLDNMFDEKSGSEFLHQMTNVGVTLVYHKAVDEDSWVGRTVNMIFRPGACSSQNILQPVIEWSTMVGGKSNFVETQTLELLSIDAISTNNEGVATEMTSLPIPAKPPTEDKKASMKMCNLSFTPLEEEGFDCFFTVTSKDGEIHLFEALSADECNRLVSGIRYSAQRLSQILILGDSSVLMSDFYDNSREPEESKLAQSEVLNKLSNAFLDGQ